MKKRIRRTRDKKIQDDLERDSGLIEVAIRELDVITRGKISKATGLPLHRIAYIFTQNKDIWNLYKIRRSTLVNLASDNIVDILSNKKDPNHFAASKYILQKYKSDLDDTLEAHDKDGDEVSVEIGKSPTASPVTVKFKSKKKTEED